MTRGEAKTKIVLLLSNAGALAKFRGGKVDEMADRAVSDPELADLLERIDPNDDATVRAFVKVIRSGLRRRARAAAPKVRTIPNVTAKRDAFALLYLAVNSADDVPDAVVEAVFALDAILERNRLDDAAVAELVPLAERLVELGPEAPFVVAIATAFAELPRRTGGFDLDDPVFRATGDEILRRLGVGGYPTK
jgi:hypothetical protein